MNGRSFSRTRTTGIENHNRDNGQRDRTQFNQRVDGYRQAVKMLMNEVNFQPPEYESFERKYMNPEEAARTLGLDAEKTRKATDYITAIVKDTRDLLGVTKQARQEGFPDHAITEMIRRATKLSREATIGKSEDMAKASINPDLAGGGDKGGGKPPPGFVPIPKSKKGGFRKPHGGGGFEYWYPGEGVTSSPHKSEHSGLHSEHAKHTPHEDVRKEFEKVKAKAEKHGIDIKGKPSSKHTVEDVQRLDRSLDKAIAKKEAAEGTPDQGDTAAQLKEADGDVAGLDKVAGIKGFESIKKLLSEMKSRRKKMGDNPSSEDVNWYGEQAKVLTRMVGRIILRGLQGDVAMGGAMAAEGGRAKGEINAIVGLHDRMKRDEAKAATRAAYDAAKKAPKAPKKAPAKKPKPEPKAEDEVKKSGGVFLDTRTGKIVVQVSTDDELRKGSGRKAMMVKRDTTGKFARRGPLPQMDHGKNPQKAEDDEETEKGIGDVAPMSMSVVSGGDVAKTKKRKKPPAEPMSKAESYRVPAGARGNARKVLEWKKKYGSEVKGMTSVGWARARQLASQETIGLDTVKRMSAFNRHRKNAAVNPKYSGEPWKDAGYVAWLGWGGTTGVDWARGITGAAKKSESEEPTVAKASDPKKTPAKPHEKVSGSSRNKPGSAATASGGVTLSESTISTLKEKVKTHNESSSKKVTLGQLKAVYRRGSGAFSTSHHPNANRHSWSMGRVNSFLKQVKSGSGHPQDNDLISKGGGPYIGPRGGKYKDPDHKIAWSDDYDHEHHVELGASSKRYRLADGDKEVEVHHPPKSKRGKHGWMPVKNLDIKDRVREKIAGKPKDGPKVIQHQEPEPEPTKSGDDYKMAHQPPDDGPEGHKIGTTDDFPKDILQHPEWYTGFPEETAKFINVLRRNSGNPDAKIKIYRAMPKAAGGNIEHGNWISPSKAYTEAHAAGEKDWHIVEAEVALKDIKWAGDDLMEWGYWGKEPAGNMSKALTAGHQIVAPVKESKNAKKKQVKKARSRHPETGFGHRDNLRPGMVLQLRKSHRGDERADAVDVLDDGCFGWGDNVYENGHQLLKAIYGKPNHRMTIRRYFGLGGEENDIVVSLLGSIKHELLGKALVTRDNRNIRITGPLKDHIPNHFLPDPDAGLLVLEPDEARELVKAFRSKS